MQAISSLKIIGENNNKVKTATKISQLTQRLASAGQYTIIAFVRTNYVLPACKGIGITILCSTYKNSHPPLATAFPRFTIKD
jgi:hypothetical protein